ncbi:MAG: class I SAM-dependent methyltransferase [Tepidiformaceae bacterium]
MTRPTYNFDRVAGIYDSTRGFPPATEVEIATNLAAIVREHNPEPSVYEVGIGTGRIAVPLASQGVRVTGIDISRQMLARLRAKNPAVRILLAEASRPPFRAASFDAAVFVHILHLVPDAAATLRETIALLRPGGLLVSANHEYAEGASGSAGAEIRRLIEEVTGAPTRQHHRHEGADAAFLGAMTQAGAAVETRILGSWSESTTARQEIAWFRDRTHSNTWALPEAAHAEVLRRFTPRVVALYGGLEVPASAEVELVARIARLPG